MGAHNDFSLDALHPFIFTGLECLFAPVWPLFIQAAIACSQHFMISAGMALHPYRTTFIAEVPHGIPGAIEMVVILMVILLPLGFKSLAACLRWLL